MTSTWLQARIAEKPELVDQLSADNVGRKQRLRWVALPSAALGIGLYRLAPIQLPGEVETFGDLVRIVASRSIGALAGQGARLEPKEAWQAFTDVLSDHTQLSKGDIVPETLLLGSKPKAVGQSR